MNFVAMSDSDSDHDTDEGYTSDDSYGRYEVNPLGVTSLKEATMQQRVGQEAAHVAALTVTRVMFLNQQRTEAQTRAIIEHRLHLKELAITTAREYIAQCTYDDLLTITLQNLHVFEEENAAEEEVPEVEEGDLDADLQPGDGLADEPVDMLADLDAYDDVIIDYDLEQDIALIHQEWTYPSYDWPSDSE